MASQGPMWLNFLIGPKNYHGPKSERAQYTRKSPKSKNLMAQQGPNLKFQSMAQLHERQAQDPPVEYAGRTQLVRLTYWVRLAYSQITNTLY